MNCKPLGFIALMAIATAVTGCEKPLFPSNMPRTQYERYDEMRGNYTPAETVDPATGMRRPALRERLSPHRD